MAVVRLAVKCEDLLFFLQVVDEACYLVVTWTWDCRVLLEGSLFEPYFFVGLARSSKGITSFCTLCLVESRGRIVGAR